MKLREFLHLLGLKPKPVRYGTALEVANLAVDGQIEIARWLHPKAYNPIPDQQHVQNLRRYLRPGDVAIDVGAHVGDSTLPIALAVGPTGAVIACEPNPFVFPTLERLSSLNRGKTNIVPLPFAANRVDGPVAMHYSDHGHCNGGIHEAVSPWVHGSAYEVIAEGRHLPSLLNERFPALLPRLRFIKIDAEGHDLAILESLDETIAAYRPFLQVEFFPIRKSPEGYREQLFGFLESRGYQIHRVEDRTTHFLAEEITVENLSASSSYDVFCAPREEPSRPR